MTKQPRIIHCSYCLEEGHRINRCIDPSILLVHEHVSEIAAIDWKTGLNSQYLTHEFNKLTEPEVQMLGYKHNIKNVTKLNNDLMISQLVHVYSANINTHEYLIKNMNKDELDYFAKKTNEYITSTDIADVSLSDIHNNLGLYDHSKKKQKSLYTYKDIPTKEEDTKIGRVLIDIKDIDDEVFALIYSSFVFCIVGVVLFVYNLLMTCHNMNEIATLL